MCVRCCGGARVGEGDGDGIRNGGGLDWAAQLSVLRAAGYGGPIGLEYFPTVESAASVAHIREVLTLPWYHRDPFDRLLIAQAKAENLPVISVDGVFDSYAVNRIW